jgi:lysophospholipase L1-like esterase
MSSTVKTYSILGDSISTFQGVTPPSGCYYGPAYGDITGVRTPEDTWWMQVIRALGGTLLVNHSWSGSTVTSPGMMPASSPSRIRRLAPEGESPDCILVFSGLNDVNGHVDPPVFGKSYRAMLRLIRETYPQAQVICGTLLAGYLGQASPFRQFAFLKRRILVYNQEIRAAGLLTGCQVADLAAWKEEYASMDGLHPNGDGMKTLADLWLRSLAQLS